MTWAIEMFDAAIKAAKEMVEEQAALRKELNEARRKRRNALARARYARTPKELRGKKKKQEPEYDNWEPETSCYCFATRPPCGWCTREIDEDEEEGV